MLSVIDPIMETGFVQKEQVSNKGSELNLWRKTMSAIISNQNPPGRCLGVVWWRRHPGYKYRLVSSPPFSIFFTLFSTPPHNISFTLILPPSYNFKCQQQTNIVNTKWRPAIMKMVVIPISRKPRQMKSRSNTLPRVLLVLARRFSCC